MSQVNIESSSITPLENIISNFLNRIAVDGSRDHGALRFLQSIASNTCTIQPDIKHEHISSFLSKPSALPGTFFVSCPQNMSICVSTFCFFDYDTTEFSLYDQFSNLLFPKMYLKQGAPIFRPAKLILPFPFPWVVGKNKDIYVFNSLGVLSVSIEYFLLEL